MLCFCIGSPDICSPQQLRCVLCVLLLACVWAPPSLTSVLPRVQPEFSRPYAAHLMRVGVRADSLPPGVSPKATYRLAKLWLQGGTISVCVLKCALKSEHGLDVWAHDTGPIIEVLCGCGPWVSVLLLSVAFSSILVLLHRRRTGGAMMNTFLSSCVTMTLELLTTPKLPTSPFLCLWWPRDRPNDGLQRDL